MSEWIMPETILPNGISYTIPDSDWIAIQQFKKAAVEKLGNQLNNYNPPGELPLYTKISRAKKNKEGKLVVFVTLPANKYERPSDPIELPITLDQTLTHSFVLGPQSRENPNIPVFYALQHAEKEQKEAVYLLHRRDVITYNSRVKFAIPDPATGAKACVYKTEKGLHNVPDIGLRLAPPQLEAAVDNYTTSYFKDARTRNFMEYAGSDLMHTLFEKDPANKETLTPKKIETNKLFSIATQCCEIIKNLNEGTLVKGVGKCLGNDIKLENFAYLDGLDGKNGKVRLIDDGAITSSLNPKEYVFYTPECAAPEVVQNDGKFKSVSIASDIYSLGTAISELALCAADDKDRVGLNTLSMMMTIGPISRRISHACIEQYLKALPQVKNCEALMVNMVHYHRQNLEGKLKKHANMTSEETTRFNHERAQIAKTRETSIISVLKAIGDSKSKIAPQQLEALAVLFKHSPDVIEDSSMPWKKLLDESNPQHLALAQAVMDAETHREIHSPKEKKWFFGLLTYTDPGKPQEITRAKDLIKNLLSGNDAAVNTAIQEANALHKVDEKEGHKNAMAADHTASSRTHPPAPAAFFSWATVKWFVGLITGNSGKNENKQEKQPPSTHAQVYTANNIINDGLGVTTAQAKHGVHCSKDLEEEALTINNEEASRVQNDSPKAVVEGPYLNDDNKREDGVTVSPMHP